MVKSLKSSKNESDKNKNINKKLLLSLIVVSVCSFVSFPIVSAVESGATIEEKEDKAVEDGSEISQISQISQMAEGWKISSEQALVDELYYATIVEKKLKTIVEEKVKTIVEEKLKTMLGGDPDRDLLVFYAHWNLHKSRIEFEQYSKEHRGLPDRKNPMLEKYLEALEFTKHMIKDYSKYLHTWTHMYH